VSPIEREVAALRYDRIVSAFKGRGRFLVQTHNNPDPDSLACAMTIRYLVERETGEDTTIAFGGVVGRAENRAMVRQLHIPLTQGDLVDYSRYDFIAICDTQPGTNYSSLPDGLVPNVVIDHHAMRPETRGAEVAIVEPEYGATSSLVAEMLLAKGVPIPTEIATGLYYGIKSETQNLARDTTEIDVEVYRALEPFVDRRLLARIESGRVPRDYYTEVLTVLSTATVQGRVVWADLGLLRVPDMVPEMADFLLRLEGMRWSCVMGDYLDTLYVSIRTSDPDADAGVAIRKAVSGMGSAGGHASMAGGQVPMPRYTDSEKETVKRAFIDGLLPLTGVADGEPEPLVRGIEDR
jgi:nanoRNase/pAp phosphatase (c-di-AMP/oligoRNAs hydrolase)